MILTKLQMRMFLDEGERWLLLLRIKVEFVYAVQERKTQYSFVSFLRESVPLNYKIPFGDLEMDARFSRLRFKRCRRKRKRKELR
jgi:hypothetical protein